MRLFPIILLEWSLSLFSGLTNIWKTGWVLLPLRLHANLKSYTDLANNCSIKYGNNSVKTYSFSRHKSGEVIFTSYSLWQGSTSETMWDQTTRSHCEKFSCKKYTTFQKKKKTHAAFLYTLQACLGSLLHLPGPGPLPRVLFFVSAKPSPKGCECLSGGEQPCKSIQRRGRWAMEPSARCAAAASGTKRLVQH